MAGSTVLGALATCWYCFRSRALASTAEYSASYLVGGYNYTAGGYYDGECIPSWAGDGFCDMINNNAECDYDGGDCCECTCSSMADFSSGCSSSFACIDPSAPCVDDDSFTAEMAEVGCVAGVGNGYCDADNNIADCDYDGGDCCECTCSSMADFSSGCSSSFACIDPSAPCVDDDSFTAEMAEVGCVAGVGNGYCDADNNIADCDYDGGDCCECTCSTSTALSSGCTSFSCIDPSASCVDDDSVTGDMVEAGCIPSYIQDGYCDHMNNIAACQYDGGDCCACTCIAGSEYDCGNNGYNCLEPSVDELYGCSTSPPAPPCSTEAQQFWVVETSTQAQLLAAAINCSGGSFEVDWKGTVVLDEAFMVTGGTFLNVTGDGSTSVIVGNGTSRIFTVIDAVIHVSGVNISSGTSTMGGGIAAGASNLSLSATHFHGNTANREGGAVWLSSSIFSWDDATFVGNTAQVGGAIFALNGTFITATGETEFTSNVATADGGAVGSVASNSRNSPKDSTFSMNGSTVFSTNTATSNGGALALLGGLAVDINEVMGVEFFNNTASVGGAIYLSSTVVGPTFSNISFLSNLAQAGGAVSAVRSGSGKGTEEDQNTPTTFDRCRFIGNKAETLGGAVHSAAGFDAFTNSIFIGNSAGAGGALRLEGTASAEGCRFEDNASDEGEGTAVSNIGTISSLKDTRFSGNAFSCQPNTYLAYHAGDACPAVCHGCPAEECDEVSFEDLLPVPSCPDVMDHSTSGGGNVTLEMISIDRGYWRATHTSEKVLSCYHDGACLGGLTGASDYCLTGYEGPYCAVCSDHYTARLGYACSKCSDNKGGLVLAIVFAVAAAVSAVIVVLYLVSGELRRNDQGAAGRLRRYLPLQSLKIVIVAWQILVQFATVANVTYPSVYQRFLDGLKAFNFDLGWLLSAGCIISIDFHDGLLIATITPIAVLLSLVGTYMAAARIHCGKEDTLQYIWNKHVSAVLFVMFMVYSSVSSVLFQAFACETLDDNMEYLRADYRIKCTSSKHKWFQALAGVMTVVYTVGIPGVFAALLLRDRAVLKNHRETRLDSARIVAIASLWGPYRPSVFYYELVECCRRIMVAGVVVFIYPNTAAQIAITLVMTFVFAVLSEALRPYASKWDTWLNRMGHSVVFASVYIALLLKVDVSDEQNDSQKVFEGTLVAAHACMILVVVVETAVLAFKLRVEQLDGPALTLQRGESSLESNGDCLEDISAIPEKGCTTWKSR